MNNLDLLKTLCNAYGISGNETMISNIIFSEISQFVDNIKIDNLGNIIAFKKGENKPAKKLMISAHIDEVGFIITYITIRTFYIRFISDI